MFKNYQKKKKVITPESKKRFWGRAARFEYQKSKGKIREKKG